MSGISSGVGLISGIDSARLIAQLMVIEGQPVRNLEARVQALDIQRTAFLELSAKILAIQNSSLRFDTLSFFRSFATSSTNESVVTAVAGETATPGSYAFMVHSLVTNHSVMSRGFADADTTPIGVGTLSLEVGNGQVNESTELNALNAGAGVRRGAIRITDRSGASAVIDLSTAITVDDVLAAINSNADVDMRAFVTGDRIVIEDLTGLEESNLIIADVDGGFTATDLGILADEEAGRIEGADLIRLSAATPLSALNDGNGVDRLFDGPDLRFQQTGWPDFDVSLTSVLALQTQTDLHVLNGGNGVRLGTIRITDRSGASVEIDLAGAITAQDAWDMIEAGLEEAEVSVSIQIVNSRFLINDTSDVADDSAGHLIVEDVDGFAAADLGIAADVDGDSISGRDIYRIATLGDVINAINYAPGNDDYVDARISDDGTGISLEANGYQNSVMVTAGADSTGHVSNAARDLGLLEAAFDPNVAFESRRLIAGLNTVLLQSLNGGGGVDAGEVSFNGTIIDFTGVDTLQDVIDRINAADAPIVASVNAAGNGIALRTETGDESTAWVIEDLTGSLAADLGIALGSDGPFYGEAVDGGNAQLQYISRQTLLADLNAGRGVQLGAIRMTGSDGTMRVVDLAGSSLTNVGDVIDRINDTLGSDSGIFARINDTGDGIVIVDTADGTLQLTIEDVDGGQAAADLRIAGTAKDGENLIDGSFEIKVEIGASDTLDDVVRKINEAGADVTASVLNAGGSTNPYSLTITSSVAGRQGYMIIGASGIDLGLTALTEARDAVVTVGGEGSSTPLLVTSNTNTLDELVEGVTFDLLAADGEEVTVTISQDIDVIVDAISAFVSAYNEVQTAIDSHTSFNADTYERGPLLGDSTVDLIRSRLHRVIMQEYAEASPVLSYLFTVGLRVGANNRLEFSESEFKDSYAESPHAVEQLFTTEETGFGPFLKETLEGLTRDFDGVLSLKDDLLSDQTELLNDQIERLNALLAAKRARLEAQFAGLESSLAALQGQQGALATLEQMLRM